MVPGTYYGVSSRQVPVSKKVGGTKRTLRFVEAGRLV